MWHSTRIITAIICLMCTLLLLLNSRSNVQCADLMSQTKMNCSLTCTDTKYQMCRFDCSTRNIYDLIPAEIPHTPNIRSITFANNRLGKLLRTHFPHPNRYTNVDFTGNQLAYIEERTFSVFNETETLSLSHNSLLNLDYDVFDGLTNLLRLDLSYNHLAVWPSMSLEPLQRVTDMNLAHNSITSLDADSFAHLPSLTRLTLDYNELSDLSADLFDSNGHLNYLSLKGNLFKIVPNIGLRSAFNLMDLDLSATQLSRLTEDDLSGLSSIRILRINRIPTLLKISKHTFGEMNSLKTLYLNNNDNLNQIDAKAFINVTDQRPLHLNAIYIRNSMLAAFDEKMLDWRRLSIIDLSGNPLNCDCKLLWMRNLSNIDGNVMKMMRCQKPWQLAERRVFELNYDDFRCSLMNKIDNEIVAISLLIVVISMLIVIIAYVCVRLSIIQKICKRRKYGNQYVRVYAKKDRIDLEWDYAAS